MLNSNLGMPRFLYSVVVILAVFFGAALFLMTYKNPGNIRYLMLFLLTLFMQLACFISLLFFFFEKTMSKHKKRDEYELKKLYKTSFKKSLAPTTYITTLLLLKSFALLNTTTGTLFTLFFILTLAILSRYFRKR